VLKWNYLDYLKIYSIIKKLFAANSFYFADRTTSDSMESARLQ